MLRRPMLLTGALALLLLQTATGYDYSIDEPPVDKDYKYNATIATAGTGITGSEGVTIKITYAGQAQTTWNTSTGASSPYYWSHNFGTPPNWTVGPHACEL